MNKLTELPTPEQIEKMAEAKFIRTLSKKTRLSGALLAYAMHFGIIVIVGNKSKKCKKQ